MKRRWKLRLKDEWRKDHTRAARREIGRRPPWVYQELKERRNRKDEER